MTSYIICDVTKALLKYDKYIEKLKLTAQAFHMQITMIYIVSMCKWNDRRTLLYNLNNFKSLPLALEHCKYVLQTVKVTCSSV